MRTAVVTCCDTPPVLDFSEQAFDLVSLAIEGFAIGVFGFTPLTGWDAGPYAFHRACVCELIAVIAFVTNENRGAPLKTSILVVNDPQNHPKVVNTRDAVRKGKVPLNAFELCPR